jgi:hypothetical protein
VFSLPQPANTAPVMISINNFFIVRFFTVLILNFNRQV